MHETRVFFTVGLRVEAARAAPRKGAKHSAGPTLRVASGERGRCLRSETVDGEAAEPGPFPGARCNDFGSGDNEGLSRLLGGAHLRVQIHRAVLVLFPWSGGTGGIALREQARQAGRWPGVGMRRVQGRVDEIPVFRAGDVTDRGLVKRHEQRRDQGQQRECRADSGTDPMQAGADQDPPLTLPTRSVFTGLAISPEGRGAARCASAWIRVFWAVCVHRRWRGWPSIRLGTRQGPGTCGPWSRSSILRGWDPPSLPQCKDALAPAASAGATLAWTDSTG